MEEKFEEYYPQYQYQQSSSCENEFIKFPTAMNDEILMDWLQEAAMSLSDDSTDKSLSEWSRKFRKRFGDAGETIVVESITQASKESSAFLLHGFKYDNCCKYKELEAVSKAIGFYN